MRIGMDVRALNFGECGFSRYITNIVSNLAEIDRKNTYILYQNQKRRIDGIEGNKNFSIKVIRAPFLIYKYLLLPIYLVKDRIDLFHSATHELPFLVFCKKISTFYDLNVELLSQLYLLKVRILSFLKISKYSACAANKIIAISANTKKDLIDLYKIPAEKIKVILLAAEKTFCLQNKELSKERVNKKFGIKSSFILYVGQIRVQKNIPRLLDAFKKIKEKGLSHKLVLVGRNNKGSEFYNLPLEIEKRGLNSEVFHISNCNETKDLASFYSAADLFVYPSLYEGFGLSVLEAMACGAPVIASSVSSVPEVAGDAGILVNPYNVDEIAVAICQVLSDRNLRNKLVDKGLERVKKFSWRKAAQETLSLYKSFAK